MSGTKARSSAPYGQACMQCAKAKSRCMLREGASTCERCHRMSKECISSSPARKRSKKDTAATKRTQLEDKLDDLVSLLRTQQTTAGSNFQNTTPRSMSTSPQESNPEDNSLTDDELSYFRTRHLPLYPLIYLPTSLSAARLSTSKPLLALALKTICNKGRTYQTELSKQLRTTIALRMMVEGEKSLDLLQSILVVMTWSLYFTAGKQFLVMLAGLARTLLSDLRMDRSLGNGMCPSIMPYAEPGTPRTNESRRALVACFTLTAMIASTFKSDVMPWSVQLELDCDHLVAAGETEGDNDLTIMARISRVAVQAAEVQQMLVDTGSAHGALHIPLLLASLDRIKRDLSDAQLNQHNISAVIATTQVSIYELALLFPPTPISISQTHTILHHKSTSYLLATLQTCKDYTERYLAIDIINFTTPTKLIFAYSLKILHKLCTLHDFVGWDPALARQSVNLISILERCADSAEGANERLKEGTGEDSVFAMAAVSMRESAANWVLPNVEARAGSGGDATAMDAWAGGDGFDLPLMDFSDEFWLDSSINL